MKLIQLNATTWADKSAISSVFLISQGQEVFIQVNMDNSGSILIPTVDNEEIANRELKEIVDRINNA